MTERGSGLAASAAWTVAPSPEVVGRDVARALEEDIGTGDVSASLLPADTRVRAALHCRQDAVVAGRPWFDACYRQVDAAIGIEWHASEGQRVAAGSVLCTLEGSARGLVTAERASINFLQTLSATATVTRAYVDAVAGTGAQILDTRKTLPGLRVAQKYAVRVGGGRNHRMGLYDAVMLKENHIAAAGSIQRAADAARRLHPGTPLIIEVESLDELDLALGVAPERILLDDFTLDAMREAVRRTARRVPLEVSGGVDLAHVRSIAETGVDCISVGALTKHVQAVDLSLRLDSRREQGTGNREQ